MDHPKTYALILTFEILVPATGSYPGFSFGGGDPLIASSKIRKFS